MFAPVVVVSNNDGCAMARSDKAKALGIKVGARSFKIRHFEEDARLDDLSANVVLYCDMSDRMDDARRRPGPRARGLQHLPPIIERLWPFRFFAATVKFSADTCQASVHSNQGLGPQGADIISLLFCSRISGRILAAKAMKSGSLNTPAQKARRSASSSNFQMWISSFMAPTSPVK
jgi:hypothetical protein